MGLVIREIRKKIPTATTAESTRAMMMVKAVMDLISSIIFSWGIAAMMDQGAETPVISMGRMRISKSVSRAGD
jgi:hypothetical protein